MGELACIAPPTSPRRQALIAAAGPFSNALICLATLHTVLNSGNISASFNPLFVPLPQEEIKKIIEQHMLNPKEFFGELPYPSTSYDDPAYDPNGYWRGRIWPHFVYWIIQTLWQNGYHAEADLTAERILAMFRKTAWLHENYNSKTGEGWDPEKRIGFPDYNWSCATVIELLLERYKEPVV